MTGLAALTSALKNVKDDKHMIGTLLDAHVVLLEQEGGVELLHWAINSRRQDVAGALAQRGVDIEAVTPGEGMTPLQRAALEGHEQLVRVLLEQGADPTNMGTRRRTPLFLVVSPFAHGLEVRVNVATLLLEHMDREGLEQREPEDGLTALAYAAQSGPVEIVSLLLDHGADARVRDKKQRTPLMLAAKRGDAGGLAVVKALLKHLQPQDLDAKDAEWDTETALHHACLSAGWCWKRKRMDRASELVRALLLAGANPDIKDRRGRTPRALAEQEADEECRAELVAAFEWWEGELERRYLLQRARRLTNVCSPVAFLEARVGAGQAVPSVEVVSLELQEGASGKRKRVSGEAHKREKRRHAVVEYVMEGLSEELFTELLDGL